MMNADMRIREDALRGVVTPGLLITDTHTHYNLGEYSTTYLKFIPFEETLRKVKSIGITSMVMSSNDCLLGNMTEGNRKAFDAAEAHPDFIKAQMVFDPRKGDKALYELEEYEKHPLFAGVKIHPRENAVRADDERYYPLYEYAEKRRIAVTSHTWDGEANNTPADYFAIMEKFPRLAMIMGHMGGTRKGIIDSCELAARYPYVYLDINGSLYSETWLECLVEEAVFERLIFGTDQAFNDPRIVVGRVLLAKIPDRQKRDILHYNYQRLKDRLAAESSAQ